MIKLNKFIYTDEGIIPPKNRETPNSVCKYYSLTPYNVEALLEGYLFASHPMQLNDIKDSKSSLYSFKHRPDISLYNQYKCGFLFDKDLRLLGTKFRNFFWKTQTPLMGLVSLTTSELNDLMWPHYTNENGFVIKFNTERLLSSLNKNSKFKVFDFSPVNYVKQVCQASIIPTLENLKAANYYMANVKNSCWIYEDEWRLFVSVDGMQPPYDHYYYKDYKFTNLEAALEKRKLYYTPSDCVDRIIWGSEFISMCSKKMETINGWRVINLKDDYKYLLPLFKYLEKNYADSFYISGLKTKNNRVSILKRIYNVYNNEVEELAIERCVKRYDIKVENDSVLVKLV